MLRPPPRATTTITMTDEPRTTASIIPPLKTVIVVESEMITTNERKTRIMFLEILLIHLPANVIQTTTTTTVPSKIPPMCHRGRHVKTIRITVGTVGHPKISREVSVLTRSVEGTTTTSTTTSLLEVETIRQGLIVKNGGETTGGLLDVLPMGTLAPMLPRLRRPTAYKMNAQEIHVRQHRRATLAKIAKSIKSTRRRSGLGTGAQPMMIRS